MDYWSQHILGAVLKVWFFAYNPYFEFVELLISYYGYIFSIINIVGWVSSRTAIQIVDRHGERCTSAIFVIGIAGTMVLMGLFPSQQMLLALLVPSVMRVLMQPFFFALFNHYVINDDHRATVNSVRSAVVGIAQFITLMAFGTLLDFVTLVQGLVIAGIVTGIIGGGYLLWYRKVFS